MPTTNINVHVRADDPVTLTARRGEVAEWVSLCVGTTEITFFPMDRDAGRLLDHLAHEITAARKALATEDPS